MDTDAGRQVEFVGPVETENRVKVPRRPCDQLFSCQDWGVLLLHVLSLLSLLLFLLSIMMLIRMSTCQKSTRAPPASKTCRVAADLDGLHSACEDTFQFWQSCSFPFVFLHMTHSAWFLTSFGQVPITNHIWQNSNNQSQITNSNIQYYNSYNEN